MDHKPDTNGSPIDHQHMYPPIQGGRYLIVERETGQIWCSNEPQQILQSHKTKTVGMSAVVGSEF
jgi:hypothetical protein